MRLYYNDNLKQTAILLGSKIIIVVHDRTGDINSLKMVNTESSKFLEFYKEVDEKYLHRQRVFEVLFKKGIEVA